MRSILPGSETMKHEQSLASLRQGRKAQFLGRLAPAGRLTGSGQPTHLQAEDQSDVVQTDFRQRPLEAKPVVGRGPALALILINDENAIRGPTEFDGPVHQRVLAVGGFAILGDLLDGGLADVDNSEPVGVTRLNLGRGGQPGWR
jgi:hypothetical protein